MTALARWLSIVLHPFVVIALMVAVTSVRLESGRSAGASVAMVAAFTIVPLAILMFLQVRRGAWENVDASRKSERPVLYAVGLGGAALLLGYLLLRQPGSFLIRGTAITLATFAVCAAITPWIKISLHAVSLCLASTVLILLGSATGWGLAALAPALFWSRVRLARHRVIEVALGAGVGVLGGLAIHFL
jgi:hypothetical protein